MSQQLKKKGGKGSTKDSTLRNGAGMANEMIRRYGPAVFKHAEFQNIISQVRRAQPKQHSSETRSICGQLLFMYSSMGAMAAETPDDAKKWQQQCKPDVQKAWDFIDFKVTKLNEKMMVGMLRLDIAQQLQDLEKLRFAYKEFKQCKKEMPRNAPVMAGPPGAPQPPDPRVTANVPLFNAAPVLGKWSEFRQYAKTMSEKIPQVFEAIKMQAQMSGRDYHVLMEYAEELDLKDTDDSSKMQMTMATIKSIRIKLRSVNCPQSASKAKQIEEDFKSMLEWKDIDTLDPSIHRILRFGGILQVVSFADMPIPMIGPYEEGRIRCRGVAELMKEFEEPDLTGKSEAELMQLQMEYQKKYGIRQIEQFDLQVDPSNPKLFKGTYLDHLYQAEEEEMKTECDLICKFDMEMVLGDEFPSDDPRAWDVPEKTTTTTDAKSITDSSATPTPTDASEEEVTAGIDDLTLD